MTSINAPRIWRYEVDQVWGTAEGTVEIGTIILDAWKADRCWHLYNFKAGTEGGWHAKLLGEATPEEADQVRAHWAARRKAKR